jgi:hypothetical protein
VEAAAEVVAPPDFTVVCRIEPRTPVLLFSQINPFPSRNCRSHQKNCLKRCAQVFQSPSRRHKARVAAVA